MSGFRRMARRLLPPLVVDWLRPPEANSHSYIWEGVYSSFAEVPVQGEGFDSAAWITATEEATAQALGSLKASPDTIPADIPPHHSLFALLVAMLGREKARLRVVDFGGGMGLAYLNLMRSLNSVPALDYLVVDNARSCDKARLLFADQPNIQFASQLPEGLADVDFLLLNGVLQFVEDYRGLVRMLAKVNAEFWFFGLLPAGDVPTFATGQRNVPGSVIPAWFFNLPELHREMAGIGYHLLYRSLLERHFDMNNLPETHRLLRQCNLLFRRSQP